MMAFRDTKVKWAGRIVGVHPRIRLTRSFDQRYHEYVGYELSLDGTTGDVAGPLTVGIGPAAHTKFHFRVGGTAHGEALPVAEPERDTVQLHRANAATAGWPRNL